MAKKAKNEVIAGDYEGKGVINGGSCPGIVLKIFKVLHLNNSTVETYEVITDEHRKSAASGVARGLVGGALLGPAGMLAGGLSANEVGIYQIAIQFKDGKRSLLEVDEEIYKDIVKNCF